MTRADVTDAPIVLWTALAWEERAVGEALTQTPGAPAGVGTLSDGTPAVLLRCGIGLRRALEAARAVPHARGFVAIGCGGALQPDLRAGDVVVASAVGLLDGDGVAQSHWPAAESAVADWAVRNDVAVRVGPIVSSPVVLRTTAQREAAARSGALVVDMESAALMGVALQRRVPFAAIRVVLDEANESLPPDEGAVNEDGTIRLGRALRLAFRHPRAVMRLAREQASCDRRLRQIAPVLLRAEALGMGARPTADATA